MRAVLLALMVVFAAHAGTASACSIAQRDEGERLAKAAGAVVGVVTERRIASETDTAYVLRVEKAHKGAIGFTAEVLAADGRMPGGAFSSCGLTLTVGQ